MSDILLREEIRALVAQLVPVDMVEDATGGSCPPAPRAVLCAAVTAPGGRGLSALQPQRLSDGT
jgi:hypothetical protein